MLEIVPDLPARRAGFPVDQRAQVNLAGVHPAKGTAARPDLAARDDDVRRERIVLDKNPLGRQLGGEPGEAVRQAHVLRGGHGGTGLHPDHQDQRASEPDHAGSQPGRSAAHCDHRAGEASAKAGALASTARSAAVAWA